MINVNSNSAASSGTVRNLESWESQWRKWLERKGVRDVEEHDMMVSDEKVVCLGGSELRDAEHLENTNIISMHCMSSDSLGLAFIGQRSDLPEFYSLVAQIRKW